MPDLPSGTVAFLFTDMEGSTALLEWDPTTPLSSIPQSGRGTRIVA